MDATSYSSKHGLTQSAPTQQLSKDTGYTFFDLNKEPCDVYEASASEAILLQGRTVGKCKYPGIAINLFLLNDHLSKTLPPYLGHPILPCLMGGEGSRVFRGPHASDKDVCVDVRERPVSELTTIVGHSMYQLIWRQVLANKGNQWLSKDMATVQSVYKIQVKPMRYNTGVICKIADKVDILFKFSPSDALQSVSGIDGIRIPLGYRCFRVVQGREPLTEPDRVKEVLDSIGFRHFKAAVPTGTDRLWSRFFHVLGHASSVDDKDVELVRKLVLSLPFDVLKTELEIHQSSHFRESPLFKFIDFMNWLAIGEDSPDYCRNLAKAWRGLDESLKLGQFVGLAALIEAQPVDQPWLAPSLLRLCRFLFLMRLADGRGAMVGWPTFKESEGPRSFIGAYNGRASRYLALGQPNVAVSPTQLVREFLSTWPKLQKELSARNVTISGVTGLWGFDDQLFWGADSTAKIALWLNSRCENPPLQQLWKQGLDAEEFQKELHGWIPEQAVSSSAESTEIPRLVAVSKVEAPQGTAGMSLGAELISQVAKPVQVSYATVVRKAEENKKREPLPSARVYRQMPVDHSSPSQANLTTAQALDPALARSPESALSMPAARPAVETAPQPAAVKAITSTAEPLPEVLSVQESISTAQEMIATAQSALATAQRVLAQVQAHKTDVALRAASPVNVVPKDALSASRDLQTMLGSPNSSGERIKECTATLLDHVDLFAPRTVERLALLRAALRPLIAGLIKRGSVKSALALADRMKSVGDGDISLWVEALHALIDSPPHLARVLSQLAVLANEGRGLPQHQTHVSAIGARLVDAALKDKSPASVVTAVKTVRFLLEQNFAVEGPLLLPLVPLARNFLKAVAKAKVEIAGEVDVILGLLQDKGLLNGLSTKDRTNLLSQLKGAPLPAMRAFEKTETKKFERASSTTSTTDGLKSLRKAAHSSRDRFGDKTVLEKAKRFHEGWPAMKEALSSSAQRGAAEVNLVTLYAHTADPHFWNAASDLCAEAQQPSEAIPELLQGFLKLPPSQFNSEISEAVLKSIKTIIAILERQSPVLSGAAGAKCRNALLDIVTHLSSPDDPALFHMAVALGGYTLKHIQTNKCPVDQERVQAYLIDLARKAFGHNLFEVIHGYGDWMSLLEPQRKKGYATAMIKLLRQRVSQVEASLAAPPAAVTEFLVQLSGICQKALYLYAEYSPEEGRKLVRLLLTAGRPYPAVGLSMHRLLRTCDGHRLFECVTGSTGGMVGMATGADLLALRAIRLKAGSSAIALMSNGAVPTAPIDPIMLQLKSLEALVDPLNDETAEIMEAHRLVGSLLLSAVLVDREPDERAKLLIYWNHYLKGLLRPLLNHLKAPVAILNGSVLVRYLTLKVSHFPAILNLLRQMFDSYSRQKTGKTGSYAEFHAFVRKSANVGKLLEANKWFDDRAVSELVELDRNMLLEDACAAVRQYSESEFQAVSRGEQQPLLSELAIELLNLFCEALWRTEQQMPANADEPRRFIEDQLKAKMQLLKTVTKRFENLPIDVDAKRFADRVAAVRALISGQHSSLLMMIKAAEAKRSSQGTKH